MQRVDPASRDRFQAALEVKLAWYGSELIALRDPQPGESYVDILRDVLAHDPDLVMVAGASSLDPLEPLFSALRALNARVVKHGVPVDPGSLLWVAYIGSVPILGLASSEMFSHKTVVELLLPRLFAGERIERRDLVRLGLGGFLRREMAFRFPNYSGPERVDD
jgi:molybdopterin biosynthesis enzyme